MSYGTMELKRTIDERKFFEYGGLFLGTYTLLLLQSELIGYVMFIPHILYLLAWVIITEYNEEQDELNMQITKDKLHANNFYANARNEAMKL